MEINMGQAQKLSKPPYLPAKEALVAKKCRFCLQLMEIKQVNLTEAVRQCYKCSTPFQLLNFNDIEFFHRSYRDINKDPADWSSNVSSEEKELTRLQSWMDQFTLTVRKYEGSSDDDVSYQSKTKLRKEALKKLVSQADDTEIEDLVKELEQSVDCTNAVSQCEWSTTGMDELEAALQRASNEIPDANSLPFSFDEFFLPEPAPPKAAQPTNFEDASRSHEDASNKILETSFPETTLTGETDVQSAVSGQTVQLEYLSEMDKSVMKEVDSEMDLGLMEMNTSLSKECYVNYVTGEMDGRGVDEKCDASHSEEILNDDITSTKHISSYESQEMEFTVKKEISVTNETSEVILEMTEEAVQTSPKSEIEVCMTEEFHNNGQTPQRYRNLKEQSHNTLNVREAPNCIIKAEFLTSTSQMDSNSDNGNDSEVSVGCATVTPESLACNGPGTSVLPSLPFSSLENILPRKTASSILHEHQPSEKVVYKHICECDDPQLLPPSKAEIENTCVQLQYSSFQYDYFPSDLDKVIFSQMMRLPSRKLHPNRKNVSKMLEMNEFDSPNRTEEFGSSQMFVNADGSCNSIFVTVPADNDITPDMFEFVSVNGMPVFFESPDGAVVPVCTEKLENLEMKFVPSPKCDNFQVILEGKALTDIQYAEDETVDISPTELGKMEDLKIGNHVATGNQIEPSSVSESGVAQSMDYAELEKEPSNVCPQTTDIVDTNGPSCEIRYVITQTDSAGFQLTQDVQLDANKNVLYPQSSQNSVHVGVECHNFKFNSDPLSFSNTMSNPFETEGSLSVTENISQPEDWNDFSLPSISQNESMSTEELNSTFSLVIDQPLKFNGSLMEEEEDELKSFTGAKFKPLSMRKPSLKEGKPEMVPRFVNLLQAVQRDMKAAKKPKRPRIVTS